MRCLSIFLCFGLLILAGCKSESEVMVSLEDGVDESAGNVPCYVITTPQATYFLEKEGGGLSSMLDVDGVDWIGFHSDPGTESQGEYRGFPNAIHKQDGSYFHARNVATEISSSEVEVEEANHVRIRFTSGNGKWQGVWDFYPDRCEFTMDRVSEGFAYWILYEGVPGGELDKTDFWYASKDGARHSIDEKQDDDLPGPEWMAFGDPKSPRMVCLLSHVDDTYPDRYYNMRDEMTVFGFGREGGKKLLTKPVTFTIGFVESTEYETVKRKVEGMLR
ncbi:MAG: hypothetical protein KJT03_12040 [Verrucomicrobiae bacterium]|nr:hypothetical protein [Verrucomicrobiae bacterium]